MTSLNYVLEKFPITNDTLLHAKWIDVGKRADTKWESVEHFIYKFTSLFSDINVDDLYDEFCDYKTLTDEDIGRDAWNACSGKLWLTCNTFTARTVKGFTSAAALLAFL